MERTVHLLIMYTMLVLTLLLFHKGRKHPRSLMLAIYAAVEVLTNGIVSLNYVAGWDFFMKFPFSHFIYKPLYCLWAPLFYFYYRHCLSVSFRFERKHLVHFIPFALFLFSFLLVWLVMGNEYIYKNLYQPGSLPKGMGLAVDIVVKLQYVYYISLMIGSLLRFQSKLIRNQEVSGVPSVNVRWLNFIVYGYAIACFVGIINFGFELDKSPIRATVNIVSISLFFLFFFAIFYDTITQKPYVSDSKHKNPAMNEEDLHVLMQKVDTLMQEKKLYLVPDLTLQLIASELDEKERSISQSINSVAKQNVNEYINALRIAYACQLLQLNRTKPIFEVMYESGFSTKGAFNLAFKKITGLTPTQYREQSLTDIE
jgi:AraC-like DNA-binding protein